MRQIDFKRPAAARPPRRRLRPALRLGVLALTTGLGLWGLAQSPLTLPLLERPAEAAAQSVERAFRDAFTPGWVAQEVAEALDAKDEARVLWLADLAQSEGLALPAATTAEIARLRAESEGWGRQTLDCLACSVEIEACPSLTSIALCNLPLELTPVGDLNALRRQGMAALAGGEVDRLETGLALVGLAATGAVLFSGGGSYAVKAGASGLRAAKRLGSLTPDMLRLLGELTDLPVNWRAVLRAAPIEEITDAAKLSRLGGVAADMGRIASNTSMTEAVVLLRHVDGAEDAARLARFSDVAKSRTYSRMEVLGKSRGFRAMMRLSDLALSALAAIYAGVLSLAMTLASWLGGRMLRALTR